MAVPGAEPVDLGDLEVAPSGHVTYRYAGRRRWQGRWFHQYRREAAKDAGAE